MQRKPIFLVLFSILALAAVVATFCRRGNDTAPLQPTVAAQCATDTLYSPMHSKGFLITAEHGSGSSTITIFNPWQGAEGVSMDFFIARGGERAPEGFSGITLNGDAGRIIAMSSTYVAMLETFSEAGRVVGVSGLDFINSGAIDRTTVKDVGYDANIDFETIVSLKP
ncbi:MAG: hypothetical protein HUJ91_02155, partial [Bacteroidales bacterium]|nr:hypothetical protein [Bacteroidales bacterium]